MIESALYVSKLDDRTIAAQQFVEACFAEHFPACVHVHATAGCGIGNSVARI
jgi:hypothetical protein